MDDSAEWRHMSTAPRDGTRILVTVRPSEQGPAEVDVAYFAKTDQFGIDGWRAADSQPGQIFAYADSELKCWMPIPQPGAGRPAPGLPSPFEGDEIQADGAGI